MTETILWRILQILRRWGGYLECPSRLCTRQLRFGWHHCIVVEFVAWLWRYLLLLPVFDQILVNQTDSVAGIRSLT